MQAKSSPCATQYAKWQLKQNSDNIYNRAAKKKQEDVKSKQ